jgi:hypothetical protein
MPHAALPGTAKDLNSPAETRLRGARLHKGTRSGIMSVMVPHSALCTNIEFACKFPIADGVADTNIGVLSDYRIMREYLCQYQVYSVGSSNPLVQCGVVDVRQ